MRALQFTGPIQRDILLRIRALVALPSASLLSRSHRSARSERVLQPGYFLIWR